MREAREGGRAAVAVQPIACALQGGGGAGSVLLLYGLVASEAGEGGRGAAGAWPQSGW